MQVSSSSNSSSTSGTTSSSSRRLSGLMSGLDTDTLVKNLTAGTQSKIDKLTQSKQLASWRQTSYREVTTALQEFQSKYFSSSSTSSNISNTKFFETSTINNTYNSYLNVSGNSTNAANMKITKISQLAVQANFTSSNKVSNEAITSMQQIQESYTASTLAGSTMTINYGGTDYALTLDSDFSLNLSDSDNLSKVASALNSEISQTTGLKGNVSFSVSGGEVTLTSTGGGSMYIKSGTSALLSGLGLKESKTGTTSPITSGTSGSSGIEPNTDYFFNDSVASGSSLDFTIGGTSYTVALSSYVSLDVGADAAACATKIVKALNTAISSNSALSGLGFKATAGTDGKVSFTTSAGTESITLSGGDQNLLQGLGLTVNSTGTTVSGSATSRAELVETTLQDSLAGSTLTFSLDGTTKKIAFDESDKDQYSTAAGLATYLQSKLNSSYGSGNVTVTNNNGVLSFKTANTTSTLSITACDTAGILGTSGALHIYAGDSNRINTNKTIEDLAASLSGTLTSNVDGTYGLTINGKDFTFKSTDTLATVISTINSDADANVTVSYSSTLDTFNITADDGGAGSKVQISTLNGSNLATVLFGKEADSAATLTFDFTAQTKEALNGKTAEINGTTYTFSADGSGTGNIIDLSGTSDAAGIANAFGAAVASSLTGYTAATSTDGKLTFTADTTGFKSSPTTSGVVSGTFKDGTGGSALTYDFTDKTQADMIGKTITIGSTTYEFATSDGETATGNTAINISSAATAADIASIFKTAVASGLTEYTDSTASGSSVVTFTNNSAADYSVTTGKNAKMTMSFDGNAADAIEIERSSNKFTVDDVNIELLKVTDSTVTETNPISFTVNNETDDLYKKISDFVTDYNSLISLISGKVNENNKTDGSTYAPLTDSQRDEMTEAQITKWETNAKKGILQSDSLLSSLNTDLRNDMSNTVSSIKSALSFIGITEQDYDTYGKLTIDETALKNALSNDAEGVASLFTSSDGIAARLEKTFTKNINTDIGDDGLLIQKAGISTRTYDISTIADEMDTYTKKIKQLKTQLETEQDRYYSKFTQLESYLSTMNTQASLFSSSSE